MVVGLLVRCGVVAGAIYYTRKIGIWGSPEQSEQLYNQAVTSARPHIQKAQKQLPFEVPALPAKGEIRYLTKHYYNQGVKGTFHFVEMIPCYAGQSVQQIKVLWNDFSQSASESALRGKK